MAERNMIEFEAEGFDWRNVVMDDDMYIDSINGQLVHPCHLADPDSEDGKDNDSAFVPLSKNESFIDLGF